LFGFREDIAPPIDGEIDGAAIESYFARKSLKRHGLTTVGDWAGSMAYYLGARTYPIQGGGRAAARRKLDQLAGEGIAARISVDGIKEPYYIPAADQPLLAELSAGTIPDAWRSLDTTTTDEVSFIAPLDDIMHRLRAKQIFDFEYIWEVYKPAHQRRWGYYTLPVLWRDHLVARIDPKLDRRNRTLAINGFWMEDDASPDDPAFAAAFARGLSRFMRYCGASAVDLNATLPAAIEAAIRQPT
jgi:hypothetical protein